MKLISHRGNISGPNSKHENTFDYLNYAYTNGYDVECDLISHRGTLYFGHDEPQEPANLGFLQSKGVWCHAKNLEALEMLLSMRTNTFWHQEDTVALTSESYIWCYPGTWLQNKNAVWLDLLGASMPENTAGIHGICSDYVEKYKK